MVSGSVIAQTTTTIAKEEALTTHESAHLTMRRRTTHFSPWKVGDRVWLETTNLCILYPSRKFCSQATGTFQNCTGSIFPHLPIKTPQQIENPQCLSHFPSTPLQKTHGPSFSRLLPDVIDNEKEYEVDSILPHKGYPGNYWYLTSWKGYSSAKNTWEPEVNLYHASSIFSSYKQLHSLH
jgi:hypothetical protein